MSKTVLANVDGFTPCFDVISSSLGHVTSTVFGSIWRYCQMSDGYCRASQEKIGERVGLKRQTVNEHVKILIENGYLRAEGHEESGTLRLYDTGKAGMSISITGVVGETDRGCMPNRQGGVDKTDTKIVLKKEIKRVSSNIPEPIREECDIDGIPDSWKEGKKTNKSILTDQEKELTLRFCELANVKMPIAESKKQYGEYQVTWWKPIKEMLRQVDGDLDRASDLIESSITKLRKDRMACGMPKSIFNTFMGELSLQAVQTGKKYYDQHGNEIVL